MGSSASKTAQKATGAAARKYPTARPTPTSVPPPSSRAAPTNAPSSGPSPAAGRQPGPTVRPRAHASGERDEAINLDASDPDFARSLRQLGAVQPNPTLSQTSTFASSPNNPSYPITPDPRKNPAIMVLDARSRLQEEADQEFLDAGKRGFEGRRFVDVGVVRQILTLREQGRSGSEIERVLGLRRGLVGSLGTRGMLEAM